jgi:phospholipid/cholesterol/gamma-HCH transport system substrate-binding protein
MKVSREFLIGVLVVIAIALLYLGVNYLKGVNLFMKQQKYYAVYTNAAGLTASNPVILNGFKIGIVKAVHMNENGDGTIIAEVILNDSHLKVPDDTKLEIMDADLFGGKAIQLVLGKSPNLAENKDTLASSVSLGLTETIKQEIEPLKQKTAQLFAGVDSVISNLNSVLGGAQTKSLGEIFSSLKVTMKNLEVTSANMNTIMTDNSSNLSSIFANVESISTNLKNNNESLSNAIKNVELITDSLAKLQLSSTLQQVNNAMSGFNNITQKINSGQGSLGQLVNNDSLHTELVNASRSLDLLLNEMRVHPKRFLSFSLISRRETNEEFSKKELEQMRSEIDEAIKKKETEGRN